MSIEVYDQDDIMRRLTGLHVASNGQPQRGEYTRGFAVAMRAMAASFGLDAQLSALIDAEAYRMGRQIDGDCEVRR